MEYKHRVVSISHRMDGNLEIDDKNVAFSGGKGYIEKDWGTAFPESRIWLQSNNFANSDSFIMMSIAKIPWLGSYFIGFLGFLFYHGDFYPFSTYKKSEITLLSFDGEKLTINFKGNEYSLKITATLNKSGILLAPKSGKMSRRIKESVDSELEVILSDLKGKEIYHDAAYRAGLKVIEGIFDILKIKKSKYNLTKNPEFNFSIGFK